MLIPVYNIVKDMSIYEEGFQWLVGILGGGSLVLFYLSCTFSNRRSVIGALIPCLLISGIIGYLTFGVGGFYIFNMLLAIGMIIALSTTIENRYGGASTCVSIFIFVMMILLLINFGSCTCSACQSCLAGC